MSRHLSQHGGQTQGRQAATWQCWWKPRKPKVSEKGYLSFGQHPKEKRWKKERGQVVLFWLSSQKGRKDQLNLLVASLGVGGMGGGMQWGQEVQQGNLLSNTAQGEFPSLGWSHGHWLTWPNWNVRSPPYSILLILLTSYFNGFYGHPETMVWM